MTIGQRHPDISRFWLHTEAPEIGRGFRTWLRVLRFQVSVDCAFVSRHEWDANTVAEFRGRDYVRVFLGPGVIPF